MLSLSLILFLLLAPCLLFTAFLSQYLSIAFLFCFLLFVVTLSLSVSFPSHYRYLLSVCVPSPSLPLFLSPILCISEFSDFYFTFLVSILLLFPKFYFECTTQTLSFQFLFMKFSEKKVLLKKYDPVWPEQTLNCGIEDKICMHSHIGSHLLLYFCSAGLERKKRGRKNN